MRQAANLSTTMRQLATALLLCTMFTTVWCKSEECQQCELTVDLLHKGWGTNSTEECVEEIAIFICVNFKIEDNYICDGIMSDFKDEFIYVIGQIIVEPHQICGLLLTDCGTVIDPFNATWHLPMPPNQPTPVDKVPVAPGHPTLRVLQLTDLHIDMLYTPGLETQCSEPQCCRPQQNPDEIDIVLDVKQPAGYWGMVGNCDSPYYLFTNMLTNIRNNHKDLDYILVTGDIVSHAVWDYTQTSHAAMVKNVSDTIRSFFPTIPVYFAVGNHEGVPIDKCVPKEWPTKCIMVSLIVAPHSVPKQYHMDWLYDAMSDAWKGWVPQDQQKSLKYNGCFMVKPAPGLRIISVNNVYGDNKNFWVYINQTDPDGTLGWVMQQLLDAEKAGDKVHMVAHIPGGSGEALEGWSINYYNIVNRFQNTISAQFFGHTHSEEYYMIYADPEDASSRPTGMAYSAPSLTTYSEYFPAYRIYTIDGNYTGSSYQVVDFEGWYLNITEANANPSNPQWKSLYASANQEYGLKSQIPSEWNNLAKRLQTDDALFQKYRENYYRRNAYDGLSSCDSNCRNGWICDIRQFHHSQKLCADLGVLPPKKSSVHYSKKSRRNSKNGETSAELYSKLRPQRADDKCKI